MKIGLSRLVGAGAIVTIALFAGLMFARSAGDRNSDAGRSELNTDSLIVRIAQDGFYRLSLDELQDAGLTLAHLDSSSLRLTLEGQTVPIHINEEAMIFYGRSPVSRYEEARSYLLELNQAGSAMASADRPPGEELDQPLATFRLTLEENNFYDGRAYGGQPVEPGQRDPWFWETIHFEDQVTVNFNLPGTVTDPALIGLSLVGVGDNPRVTEDHDVNLILNGTYLESLAWDGETMTTAGVQLPPGLLQPGENNLVLDNPASGSSSVDIMRLDWIEVSYQADPVATGDNIVISDVEGNLTLAGFSGEPLLFDIADPDDPVLLTASIDDAGQARVRLEDSVELHAVGPEGFLYPAGLRARRQPVLNDPTNQADLIIIAPESYTSELQPLVEQRQKQGLSAMIVALEQLQDEFVQYGTGPASINAFITHAANNWQEPQAAYLLLVGDGTYDYRDYLGQGQENMLPSPMVNVNYSGETTSDARMADIDGDLRPDLAVGRWPVNSAAQVAELVQRTIAYEQANVSPRALFAADGTERQFLNLNKAVVEEAGFDLGQTIHLDGPTTHELGEAWQEGAWLVTYAGHGSPDRWGKDNVLSSDAVSELKTTFAAPIVLQLTCLTGLFAHPSIDSLSEAMLLDNNGPIAIVAATSLSLSNHQRPFGASFVAALQDPAVERVGDAFHVAKRQLDIEANDALREISDTYTLFGDPSALIRRPDSE